MEINRGEYPTDTRAENVVVGKTEDAMRAEGQMGDDGEVVVGEDTCGPKDAQEGEVTDFERLERNLQNSGGRAAGNAWGASGMGTVVERESRTDTDTRRSS